MCDKLQQDAVSIGQAGPAKTSAQLVKRLHQLAAKWTATSKHSTDPTLRASVRKAASVFNELAASVQSGKKISLAQLQAKLKSASAGLRKACPQVSNT